MKKYKDGDELLAARKERRFESVKAKARRQADAYVEAAWRCCYEARCRKYGFTEKVDHFTRSDVLRTYGDCCFYCGGPFEELDHFIPVALRGEHTIENVRPSCRFCNASKSDSIPLLP